MAERQEISVRKQNFSELENVSVPLMSKAGFDVHVSGTGLSFLLISFIEKLHVSERLLLGGVRYSSKDLSGMSQALNIRLLCVVLVSRHCLFHEVTGSSSLEEGWGPVGSDIVIDLSNSCPPLPSSQTPHADSRTSLSQRAEPVPLRARHPHHPSSFSNSLAVKKTRQRVTAISSHLTYTASKIL
mmetsp:Transcript_15257/g.62308  ORF Transcript_15257/g.62308 Transcript_15257/m.62308 type:complete len:185 (-) Transcript_15257:654-1208(-)